MKAYDRIITRTFVPSHDTFLEDEPDISLPRLTLRTFIIEPRSIITGLSVIFGGDQWLTFTFLQNSPLSVGDFFTVSAPTEFAIACCSVYARGDVDFGNVAVVKLPSDDFLARDFVLHSLRTSNFKSHAFIECRSLINWRPLPPRCDTVPTAAAHPVRIHTMDSDVGGGSEDGLQQHVLQELCQRICQIGKLRGRIWMDYVSARVAALSGDPDELWNFFGIAVRPCYGEEKTVVHHNRHSKDDGILEIPSSLWTFDSTYDSTFYSRAEQPGCLGNLLDRWTPQVTKLAASIRRLGISNQCSRKPVNIAVIHTSGSNAMFVNSMSNYLGWRTLSDAISTNGKPLDVPFTSRGRQTLPCPSINADVVFTHLVAPSRHTESKTSIQAFWKSIRELGELHAVCFRLPPSKAGSSGVLKKLCDILFSEAPTNICFVPLPNEGDDPDGLEDMDFFFDNSNVFPIDNEPYRYLTVRKQIPELSYGKLDDFEHRWTQSRNAAIDLLLFIERARPVDLSFAAFHAMQGGET